MEDLLPNLLAAAVYALLGIVIFVLAIVGLDRMTPGTMWKEIIEEHNTAVAVLIGCLAIGISIIIAAAIF
jgi:putative membrane protein